MTPTEEFIDFALELNDSASYEEPSPRPLEHEYIPYSPRGFALDGTSLCGQNACGASRMNPIHFVTP